jgi:hypothetical protein
MRIGAALVRTGGDDGGVARELLIGPDANRRKMNQRIEPADAARNFDEGIDDRVARDPVELLVRQYECALLCVEARLEIRRQDEPRPEHADQRRPDRRISVAEILSLPQSRVLLGGVTGDQTGLEGRYTMELDYPFPQRPADPTAPPDFAGASLSTAIREQWGLRLVPGKGPFQVLVVESAQPPTTD